MAIQWNRIEWCKKEAQRGKKNIKTNKITLIFLWCKFNSDDDDDCDDNDGKEAAHRKERAHRSAGKRLHQQIKHYQKWNNYFGMQTKWFNKISARTNNGIRTQTKNGQNNWIELENVNGKTALHKRRKIITMNGKRLANRIMVKREENENQK